MEKYIVGTDIGTSVAKVILFDKNGNEVDTVSGAIQHFSSQPLYMEMDMREVYDEVCNLIIKIKDKNNLLPEQIIGIGLSGQGEGLWPIGYDGEPVGNAIMWCDARAGEIAGRFFREPEKLGRIIELSGGVLSGGSGGAVIRWILENEPERMEKIQWIGTCFDWLKFKMTGQMSLSESYTADVLDIHKMEYSDELMELYGISQVRDKFPPLNQTVNNHAPLSPHGARKLGLCEGIPVAAGPFDMSACMVGLGVIHPGTVGVVLGTSNIISYPMTSSTGDPIDGIAVTKAYVCDDHWMRMAGTMTATPNLDWAIHRLGPACGIRKSDYDKLETLMNDIPLGCDGLIYHPYLSTTGERSPFMDANARAQFTGLSLEHTAVHMLRAVYEGVGYSILDCMKMMRSYDVKEYRIGGGGAKSPFLMQMLADMTGIETVKMCGNEVGAKGAAICASVAAGIFTGIEETLNAVVKEEKRYYPNPDNTKKYEQFYNLYKIIRQDSQNFWNERSKLN